MENGYIKNIFTDKANNFKQHSFYPVEYCEWKVSSKKEAPEHVAKPRPKKEDNGEKKVFSAKDIDF